MIFQFSFSDLNRQRPESREKGFTLPEILIALTVFMFVIAGVIATHLFGLRMFQTNQAKLNVSAWSRNTFGKISDEVHSCAALSVGNINFTNGDFEGLLDGEIQQGDALLINPTTNANSYILYYINPSDSTFRRVTNQTNVINTTNAIAILAYSVTNIVAFSAQDFSGAVLTNKINDRVIHLTLEMNQPASFMTDPDYYKLETSITRRSLQ